MEAQVYDMHLAIVRFYLRLHMRIWWNGRHAGLKNQCLERESSNLSIRTKWFSGEIGKRNGLKHRKLWVRLPSGLQYGAVAKLVARNRLKICRDESPVSVRLRPALQNVL